MDLTSLNDRQREAVTAPLGPVLVLAGAGSGKTRVLTYRAAYLIEQNLFAPENILALTFTNKAAKEMQGRVQQLLRGRPSGAGLPTMGTFHALGAKILRRDIPALGYSRGFVIFDSDDQLKVLREVIETLQLGKKFPPTLFRSYISTAKNFLQTPAEFNIGLDFRMQEMVQNVYANYQNFLHQQNGVDFDDLLMLPIKIFQLQSKTLARYQQLFQYILVDEYQDTNQAQYIFLQLLAQHRNLFVVGDDAQSIYGFRGSNIRNILNFEQDFPEAKIIKLEQNYRSTKNILAVAQKVIELNSEQKPKTLWTDNEAGRKIMVRELPDSREEAWFVAKKIIQMSSAGSDDSGELHYEAEDEQDQAEANPHKPFSILDQFLAKQRRFGGGFRGPEAQLPAEHAPLHDYAVLYRTHAQSREIEEAFLTAGIPYQIVGGVKFYERKEIKDVLAYLRLTLNFRDLVSLKRVINEPARGIGDKSHRVIKEFLLENTKVGGGEGGMGLAEFRERLKNIVLPSKQHAAVQSFFAMLEDFSGISDRAVLTDLLKFVLQQTKYEQWLSDGSEIGLARVENVRELLNVAVKFDQLSWRQGLEAFLEEVALVAEIDALQDEQDAVTMMTLHSAKGLEFDTVFFVGLEEGLLPHSQSLLDPEELAEEVRLAYVGLTRARRTLFLLYARTRLLFGTLTANVPSRILRALPSQYIDGDVPEGMSYDPSDF